MRKLACLLGLVAASALLFTACDDDDTDPGSGGAGGVGGTGGSETGGSGGGGGAAGSGGQPIQPWELFASGSRLEAVYWDGGDGAEIFRHFNDTVLGQTCVFAQVSDGSVRCVPTFFVFDPYIDSGCTQNIAVVDSCEDPPPAYVYHGGETACSTDVRSRIVYTVGSAISASTIYIGGGSTCLELTGWDLSDSTEYLLSAADVTVFAEATFTGIEVDGNLGQRVATTADGAHQVLFAYDVPRDANCIPQQIGNDTLCVGLAAHSREYSSSATCDPQDVARYYEPDECAEPSVILKHAPAANACDPDELTLYAVGSEIDASLVYEDSGGNCSAVSSSSGPYYREGAVAPDGYVPAFSQTTLGTGRLQVDVYSSPGGALLGYVQPTRFRDTARDEDCSPRSLEDGSLRCLPGSREIGASGAHYFADAACTTELLAVSQSACGTAPVYGAYRVANTQGCGTVTSAIHTVGALFTDDVYEGDADGSNCVAPASQPTDLDFYQLGAEVPPTDFVELTLETKPVQ